MNYKYVRTNERNGKMCERFKLLSIVFNVIIYLGVIIFICLSTPSNLYSQQKEIKHKYSKIPDDEARIFIEEKIKGFHGIMINPYLDHPGYHLKLPLEKGTVVSGIKINQNDKVVFVNLKLEFGFSSGGKEFLFKGIFASTVDLESQNWQIWEGWKEPKRTFLEKGVYELYVEEKYFLLQRRYYSFRFTPKKKYSEFNPKPKTGKIILTTNSKGTPGFLLEYFNEEEVELIAR